jgi:hypothetical protein
MLLVKLLEILSHDFAGAATRPTVRISGFDERIYDHDTPLRYKGAKCQRSRSREMAGGGKVVNQGISISFCQNSRTAMSVQLFLPLTPGVCMMQHKSAFICSRNQMHKLFVA